METSEDIVIVGGGIAGLSLALALHRLGLKALVLESCDTLRVASAAFTTWTNAWKALDALGVGDSLRRQHCRLSRIIVTSVDAGVQTAQHSYGDHEVRCVKRKVLVETLAKELLSNTIRFSSKVVSIVKSGYFKLIHLADGSILKTKVVIGCDGVNSAVARWLGFKKPLSTKRFAITGHAKYDKTHGLDPHFLQFTGYGKRYGILPCNSTVDWYFTWYPTAEDDETKGNPMKLKQFVLSNLGEVQDGIKEIFEKTKEDDIICASLKFRPPWELLWGDISKDNVCVAGDALHPMTPELGQGACSALEYTIVLAKHLAEAFSKEPNSEELEYKNIDVGLKKYAKERRWRAIDLVTTAFCIGFLQQSDRKVISFTRDKFFATYLAGLLLKKADFDCGILGNY